jgi:hypothetical protein
LFTAADMSRVDVTMRFHLTGIAIALAVILYVVWEASCHGRTSFRMGRETMAITVTEASNRVLSYYYTVSSRKELRVARTHFRDGGGWWPPQFQLISGADPNVVAVIERDDPQAVLILYDNASGTSWPADTADIGQGLLGRFSGQSGRGYHISITDQEKEGK